MTGFWSCRFATLQTLLVGKKKVSLRDETSQLLNDIEIAEYEDIFDETSEDEEAA